MTGDVARELSARARRCSTAMTRGVKAPGIQGYRRRSNCTEQLNQTMNVNIDDIPPFTFIIFRARFDERPRIWSNSALPSWTHDERCRTPAGASVKTDLS